MRIHMWGPSAKAAMSTLSFRTCNCSLVSFVQRPTCTKLPSPMSASTSDSDRRAGRPSSTDSWSPAQQWANTKPKSCGRQCAQTCTTIAQGKGCITTVLHLGLQCIVQYCAVQCSTEPSAQIACGCHTQRTTARACMLPYRAHSAHDDLLLLTATWRIEASDGSETRGLGAGSTGG